MIKNVYAVMAVLVLANAAHGVEYSRIHPFNVGSRVLSFRKTGSGLFVPAVISRTEAAMSYLKSEMLIKNIQIDQPWDGENAEVRIKQALAGRCLTVTGTPQNGGLGLEYMPCVAKTAGLAFRRQVFFLRTNGHRASALESSIYRDLGISNQILKCVEQLGASQVGLRDCAGVGNWTITH